MGRHRGGKTLQEMDHKQGTGAFKYAEFPGASSRITTFWWKWAVSVVVPGFGQVIRESELSPLYLRQKASGLVGIFGRHQDLDLAETVEGQAVGLAQRLAPGRGLDAVGRQKRPHLRLLELTLGGMGNDPSVFHLVDGNTPLC